MACKLVLHFQGCCMVLQQKNSPFKCLKVIGVNNNLFCFTFKTHLKTLLDDALSIKRYEI